MIQHIQKVKIIATLGPASSSIEMIRKLIKAGVNLFRLNFSHGDHDFHGENIKKIRELERELGTVLGIIADLQGPKLRVGAFRDKKGIILKTGQSFTLDLLNEPGTEERVSFPHPDILKVIKPGHTILLVDGKIKLEVEENSPTTLLTRVKVGGALSSHQGVNIPEVSLPISPLTAKDKEDLKFILKQDIDYVALSFVQKASDIQELRALTKEKIGIVAKIEKPQALEHLEDIVSLSDGIMIARGDLGVECPLEKVPGFQRHIIHLSRKYARPVIVATQMLESMIVNPSPTRAEVSDVATAVYEGADAVMLSGESAVGKYPDLAVEMMHKIIMNCTVEESSLEISSPLKITDKVADSLAFAANHIAQSLGAKLIVTFTASGLTALRASHKRPPCAILALTPHLKTARRLTLAWGVKAELISDVNGTDQLLEMARHYAKKEKIVTSRDKIVVTFGVPFNKVGTTNTLHVDVI